MRRLIATLVLLVGSLAAASSAALAVGQADNCVHFRNNDGYVGERCGQLLPDDGSSAFTRLPGCDYWDAATNTTGTGKVLRWVEVPSKELPTNPNVDISGWVQWLLRADRKFPQGFRVFDVFCDDHPKETTAVTILDPVLDPRPRIAEIEASLQLPDFQIVTVPDKSVWGGLVVNVHTAFGVRSDAWQPVKSPPEDFLGWQLQVVAVPRVLSFQVGGRTVPCVDGFTAPDEGSLIFPPEPPGFRDQKLDPP